MKISKGTTIQIATNATGNERTEEEYRKLEWGEPLPAIPYNVMVDPDWFSTQPINSVKTKKT